ncbi:MAG TPA: zinc-binding dehydrogenase [Thermomicrobiales bacterium]|nr:zinc-binding dehydrogenase [Thermomicrobiales bacterium]
MRGMVFLGGRRVALRDFPAPTPGPGEAVVAIRAAGLCGSDLGLYRGERAAPWIGGHEPCGEVAALGPGATGPEVGTRVIVYHYAGCGVCRYCRAGWEQLCARGGHRVYGFGEHGGNAEALVVPARALVPLPAPLSFEEGAAIACGTGTAYAALVRLDVSGRDTLAVYGQGPVGLSATLLGAAMGARVIAVDRLPARLALARALGAAEVVDATATDPVAAVRALTGGAGADATLDCTGSAAARAQAVRSARVFGRACFVGEGGTVTLDPSPDLIHRQLTLYGSWTFSTVLLEECARFIVERRVPLGRLITGRFPLEQAGEAFRQFEAGAPGKFVLFMPA